MELSQNPQGQAIDNATFLPFAEAQGEPASI